MSTSQIILKCKYVCHNIFMSIKCLYKFHIKSHTYIVSGHCISNIPHDYKGMHWISVKPPGQHHPNSRINRQNDQKGDQKGIHPPEEGEIYTCTLNYIATHSCSSQYCIKNIFLFFIIKNHPIRRSHFSTLEYL